VRIAPLEISVSDLDSYRTIYVKDGGYVKARWYSDFIQMETRNMFAMIDNKEHLQRRKLFAQQCSNTSVLKYEPFIRGLADVLVKKIIRDAKTNTADLFKWFLFFTADVTGQVSFGKTFDMVEKEEVSTINLDVINQSS